MNEILDECIKSHGPLADSSSRFWMPSVLCVFQTAPIVLEFLLITYHWIFIVSPFRDELSEQLELKKKEKKKMRKKLKTFEDEFFEETGR